MIYSYLWPDQTEAVICLCGRHHPLRSHLSNPQAGEFWTYTGSHLPRVCRQLRYETLGHFFSSSDFVLPLRYILQADEQFKLEDEWERFVRFYVCRMVRQVRRLTVHAGNINEVVVDLARNWSGKSETERELLDRGFAICSGVDLQCGFARRCVRPCLHPGARMLVVFEHQRAEGRITSIDFDNREATAAQIQKDLRPDFYGYDSWTRGNLWPDLLAKWYGDEMLRSSVTEDAIWELMWFDDVSDEATDHGRDLEALAGLLNIVRPGGLGPRCVIDEDPDVSTDNFMDAYAPFSGRQMAFSHDWKQSPSGSGVAVDVEGSSSCFGTLVDGLRHPTRSPEELQYMDLINVITLPEMERIFQGTTSRLWEWERLFRVVNPHVLRLGHTMH
jgi:hypothetical protein